MMEMMEEMIPLLLTTSSLNRHPCPEIPKKSLGLCIQFILFIRHG